MTLCVKAQSQSLWASLNGTLNTLWQFGRIFMFGQIKLTFLLDKVRASYIHMSQTQTEQSKLKANINGMVKKNETCFFKYCWTFHYSLYLLPYTFLYEFWCDLSDKFCLRNLFHKSLISHSSHLCELLCILCILKCLVKSLFSLNALPHPSHLNGFSPVWILLWTFKWEFFEKLFWQSSHLCGFSPVWVLKRSVNECLWEKVLSQKLHF